MYRRTSRRRFSDSRPYASRRQFLGHPMPRGIGKNEPPEAIAFHAARAWHWQLREANENNWWLVEDFLEALQNGDVWNLRKPKYFIKQISRLKKLAESAEFLAEEIRDEIEDASSIDFK